MQYIRRGATAYLGDKIVVVLNRASVNGWDCLCIASDKPQYIYTDIFVFDEELRAAESVQEYCSACIGSQEEENDG